MVSNQGKMELSFMNFKANHPDWNPGMGGSEFLRALGKKSTLFDIKGKRPLPRQDMGESLAESFLKGESMIHSQPQHLARELTAMLDAIYEANKRNIWFD